MPTMSDTVVLGKPKHDPNKQHAHACNGGDVTWENESLCTCRIIFDKGMGTPFNTSDFEVPPGGHKHTPVRDKCQPKTYGYTIECVENAHGKIDPDVIIDR